VTTTAVTPARPNAPARPPAKTLDDHLRSPQLQAELAKALPSHVPAEQFMRVALTTVKKTPGLLKCDPMSVVACVMEAASVGLAIDSSLGHAYLIPRGGTCTLLYGYRGLCELSYRSDKIKSIEAHVVYEKDVFKYVLGDESKLRHVPTWDDEPGGIKAVYAIATLADGSKRWEVLHRRDIDRIKRSASIGADSPWKNHEPEMWKKSAVRALSKYLPKATELQRAIAAEDSTHIDAGAYATTLTATPVNECSACGVEISARQASLSKKASGRALCNAAECAAPPAELDEAPADKAVPEEKAAPPPAAPATEPAKPAAPAPAAPQAPDGDADRAKMAALYARMTNQNQRRAFWKSLAFKEVPKDLSEIADDFVPIVTEQLLQVIGQ
jgi:recombination protein RecT